MGCFQEIRHHGYQCPSSPSSKTNKASASKQSCMLQEIMLTDDLLQGSQPHIPGANGANEGKLEAEIMELVCYLWDNYLQLYDAEEVFIMGVGYAYIGIKLLLLNRSTYTLPEDSTSSFCTFANSSLVTSPPRLQIQTQRHHQLCHRCPASRQIRCRREPLNLVSTKLARLRHE